MKEKIKNQWIEFPRIPGNELFNDLLSKMLAIDEKDRIYWDEMYSHPLFQKE